MSDNETAIFISDHRNQPSTCFALVWLLCLLLFFIGQSKELTARTLSQPAGGAYIALDRVRQEGLEARSLELGKPIERELKGGESHSYKITLAADEYLQVVVEQRGIDVVLTLVGPDGKSHSEVDSSKAAQESLSFVAERAGDYRLEVRPTQKDAASASYEVNLVALRAPTADDRSLAEALRLFRQARGLANEGKLDEATPLAERALGLREKALGPTHLEVAHALSLLARIHDYKGEPARGELLFRRAQVIMEQTLGPDHIDLAEVLNDFANLFARKSDYAQAKPLHLRALMIREKTLGPEHTSVASSLNNLATLYAEEGDYTQAELFDQRALSIREKRLGSEHPSVAASLNNLGLLYRDRADYAKAGALFRRSLSILEKALGPDHPNVALLLYNLATVVELAGDYAQAEPLYQQALARWEKRLGAEHPQVAVYLQGLAGLYEKKRDYAKAESLYQRALLIREKAFGPDYADVGTTLNDLGRLYFERGQEGDYARAESILRRALTVLETALGDHPKVVQPLVNLARLYRARGDIEQALVFLSRAVEVQERSFNRNLLLGSERQKIGYLKLFAQDINNILSLQTQLAPRNPQALRLALTTLLRRKGRALEAMSDNIAVLRARAEPQDRALFDKLSDARSQLSTFALKGLDKKNADAYRSRLKQLEDEVDSLEAEVSVRSAEFRAGSRPITLEVVQSAVPEGATLIEFALYQPVEAQTADRKQSRYAAYLLTHQGQAQWVDLGEAALIDRAVEDWRRALRDPERADVRRLARALDARVLQPVRALLGPSQHLLISPDGPLNLIPFAALVDEHDNYLIEHYTIAYLTSGRDLLRLQVKRESKSPSVIVADPAFGEPAMTGASAQGAQLNKASGSQDGARNRVDYSQVFFGPLPGVGDEVRALRELLPQATFFIKEQATEAALKGVHAPSILHVATHGFFLQEMGNATIERRVEGTRLGKWAVSVEDPLLRSGLALAGANQGSSGSDDGVLTALEATGLDLWGTKLVVLSACDTGIGEVKNGDGVYGLRRALVLAGAESQMMSLWQVSDRSTRDLMIGYYKGLMQKQGRAEALRLVQLQMLRSKSRGHPYYWASFIQSGEWANLEGKR
jgi:CHAT domain-containing protein/Tfp pilus assembly protein PilF